MAFLRLILDADDVSLHNFVDALRASERVLHDVELNTRFATDTALDWRIESITSQSPIDTLLRAVPTNGITPEIALDVTRNAVAGLGVLDRDESIPPRFGDEGLRAASALGLALRRGGFRLRVSALDDDHNSTEDAQVTSSIRAHAQESRKPATDTIGSVVGLLHAIDVGHTAGPGRRPSVSVFDEGRRRSLKCYFERDRVSEFRDRQDLLGRRVMVGGIVRRNARGQPVHLDLRRFRVLADREETPTADELLGIAPDITDGLPAEDYLREQRRG